MEGGPFRQTGLREAKGNGKEAAYFPLTDSFRKFMREVFPAVARSPLNHIVEGLIGDFYPFAEKDEFGSFMLVRGGAMREYLLKTNDLNKNIVGYAHALQPEQIGRSARVREIFDHAFGENRDLDLGVFLASPFALGDIIGASLEGFGFEQQSRQVMATEDRPVTTTAMSNGQYSATIVSLNVGIGQSLPLAKIHFYDNATGEAVFDMDIAGLPKTRLQRRDSLRLGNIQADVDAFAIGYIAYGLSGKELELTNYYIKGRGMSLVQAIAIGFLMEGTIEPFDFSRDFVQAFSASFREAGVRDTILFTNSNITIGELKNMAVASPTLPVDMNMKSLLVDSFPNLKHRFNPTFSDVLYSVAYSPIFTLCKVRKNGALSYTPLGQMLDAPEKFTGFIDQMCTMINRSVDCDQLMTVNDAAQMPLAEIIYKTAVHFHPEMFGPLLVISALKKMGLLAGEYPETIEGFLRLMNPLYLVKDEPYITQQIPYFLEKLEEPEA